MWTDSVVFAERIVGAGLAWHRPEPDPGSDAAALLPHLYGDRPVWTATLAAPLRWPHLFVVESADRSQFDLLVALSRERVTLPDGTLLLAGAGRGLHGQRGRAWAAVAGNIHLSLWLAPPPTAARTPMALLAMTAVAVIDAIDAIPGLERRASIKWVNDILIEDAKVCGMLTHVAHRPGGILGVVGLGLNVEVVPEITPNAHVPAVTSLLSAGGRPHACRLGPVLLTLLGALDRAYATLRRDGPASLAARYRARSLVLGRTVALCADEPDGTPRVVAEGRVVRLGDELELFLHGHDRPFTTGRLLLRPPSADPEP